jgi:branched-chain amino acid transport system permease protein
MTPRAIIYGLSGGIGALAGVLFALYNAFVTPDILYWSVSGEALVMAVIGGARSVWGPAIGAVIFFLLKDAAGDMTEHWQGVVGVVLVAVTLLAPSGVTGIMAKLTRSVSARLR